MGRIKTNKQGYSHNYFGNNKLKPKSKRSQITIFIILALAIVIVLILILIRRPDFSVITTPKTPVNNIKYCSEDILQGSVNFLASQGGSANPSLFYMFNGTKIEYLCYTTENYQRCIMQKPMLKDSFQNEIEKYIGPKIKECFEIEKSSLERKGYSVSYKISNISVDLVPENIILRINSDLRVTKSKTESYKDIKITKASKYYELVMITSSILNWEARYGDSEIMNYMMFYPELRVEKKKQDEGTTIYIITDKNTREQFVFASRSVVIPVGI